MGRARPITTTMRWLALGLLLLAADVRAEFVIDEPPVVRTCGTQPSWPKAMTCLAQHGAVKVLRSGKGLQLVHVEQTRDDGTISDADVYLFVERAGAWHIGGMYDGGTSPFELLAIEPYTIGNHTGYRVEIGVNMMSTFSPDDGATTVPALWRLRRSLYCSGLSYGCPDATLACDVMVHGKTIYTFRGKPEIDDNAIVIRGDRSKAGPCAPADRMFHGWPSTKH